MSILKISIVDQILEGQRLALARLLTHIENGTSEGRKALDQLFPYAGKAHLIGVTGAPGTGKSSLVNQIAYAYRHPADGIPLRVGVIAIDPTSPFSGGAILGDRVRMRDLAGDSGVFIRSMATRGSLGGLASATSDMVMAMDAAGYEAIIIETVGAGQAEVEIAHLAHTTLLVEAPGLGDEIQAIKAGIMEIADLLVINKADLPGVEMTENALRSALQLGNPVQKSSLMKSGEFDHHISGDGAVEAEETIGRSESNHWIPPIIRTVAPERKGISELMAAINQHYQFIGKYGELELRSRMRLKSEVDLLIRDMLVRRWKENLPGENYTEALARVYNREISPWQAMEILTQDRA